jgi:predicted PhzF superfamily epimerase YddE/YHI9
MAADDTIACSRELAAWIKWSKTRKQTADFGSDFLATQGAIVGRAGKLGLSIADDAIRVGGTAITCIDGTLSW